MSFEFRKAFEKATKDRALTFSQQWTMTDESIFQRYHLFLYNPKYTSYLKFIQFYNQQQYLFHFF